MVNCSHESHTSIEDYLEILNQKFENLQVGKKWTSMCSKLRETDYSRIAFFWRVIRGLRVVG